MVALLALLLAYTPSFVTPEMTYRNGLTDEQYKYLWSLGKTPQIDQNTARDWMFKSSRFSNTTNWLAICGASNDFARLSYVLGEDNYWLGETNRVLWATNGILTATCERLADDVKTLFIGYTNQLAQTTAYSNAYVIASVFAESAQAKVLDEIADLNAKIAKYEEYKTKYPLLKAVWNALIEDAQNRIRILEAVVSPGPSK